MKCPKCKSFTVTTERKPNGNTRCSKCGYEAPSKTFELKPDVNTKPKIRKISFNAEFPPNYFGDNSILESIELGVEIKLENVKAAGQDKYDIVKDIKDALDRVKEKWS